MIPKVIHYCWFGRREKPKLAKKCIASWKKYCPDYEIVEWNEDNFNISHNDYTLFTYNHRLYAYLSDYVRLWAVEQFGGLYFDTDVELICSPQCLLENDSFFGFENDEYITTGIGFGAKAHHPAVQAMKEAYDLKTIDGLNTDYNNWGHLTGSPKMNTGALLPYGLLQNGKRQSICGAEILSPDFFCPFDDVTGVLSITANTIGIHWYMKSANKALARVRSRFSRPLHRVIKYLRSQKGGNKSNDAR